MKPVALLVLAVCCFQSVFAQSTIQTAKECRIAGGIGFGGALSNGQAAGRELWLQLDYKLNQQFSVAMEFENMTYTLLAYSFPVPEELKGRNMVGNHFSLFIKYHIETRSPLKLALGSGWTYALKTEAYYYYANSSAMQDLRYNVNTFDDYDVPVLLEFGYPLSNVINVQARVKCHFTTVNRNTYASGIGLSLKL